MGLRGKCLSASEEEGLLPQHLEQQEPLRNAELHECIL